MDLKIIPYIVNGEENKNLDVNTLTQGRVGIQKMQDECGNDRLAENYTKWLKLNTMSMYCVVWDKENDQPIMTTGAQHMSDNCCRLFSRYYLWK